MTFGLTKCKFCNYVSDIKCNIIRHQNAKHRQEINDNVVLEHRGENVISNEENVISNEENVISNEENVISNKFICKTCNKYYKTKKYLLNHEQNCKKVDILTCPRCMISFTNRHNKNRHIKANKCEARSIMHARIPNVQNITNNIQNIEKQINNNNNIYINNFGSERTDYISNDHIYKILISGINTLPLYIQMKHFDKDFPENNNIAFTNENKCKVLENNIWKEKDLGILSSKLIHDNSEVLLLYCEDNEVELSNIIQNDDILDHIKDKLVVIYNKADSKKYNEVLVKIRDLVKNNKS